MTVEHPGEDLLTTYSIDPALVPDRAELEVHLRTCTACEAQLAEIRAFEALLADDASWPSEEDPDVAPAALREIAVRTRREDEEAEELLRPFLEGPAPAFVWADLPSRPRYYTAGVVRRLAAAADKMSYTNPRHALNLAETAIGVAGMLSTAVYAQEELAACNGIAWKQRANALRRLGRYTDAREALDRAERSYRQLPRPELDLASLGYIRATTYTEQQEYEIAERLAAESTAAFSHLGQTELYVASRLLEGTIAFERRDLARAQEIFETVFAYGEANGELAWLAHGALALGNCALERADLTSAARFLHASLMHFGSLGVTIGQIRSRWGLALVVRRGGRPRSAVPRLVSARDEFLAIGAATDAALVTLDLMETFMDLGKAREVQRAAGNVVTLLKEHGMLTGAITAADYLEEAAAMRKLTPGVIDYVRRYLRRVDFEPDFAFAPPS